MGLELGYCSSQRHSGKDWREQGDGHGGQFAGRHVVVRMHVVNHM